MDLAEMKTKTISDLVQVAQDLSIVGISGLRKQELIFKILEAQTEKNGLIFAEGVLEILPEGYGFLRSPDYNYLPGPDDIYVSPSQIKRFDLHTGDTVSGQVRPPKEGERYFALLRVEAVNLENPETSKDKILFDNLTPLYPQEKLNLETSARSCRRASSTCSARSGRGSAALIVSPPKAGKTILLQKHRQRDHREPSRGRADRAADRRAARGSHRHAAHGRRREVIVSHVRRAAERHVQVADMVIEKAKRLVEHGKDVVILLDSITRLARAHNTVVPHSGKILSGGVDANALQRPEAVLRLGAQHRGGRHRSPSSPPRSSRPARAWTRSSSRSSRAPATWSWCSTAKLADKRIFPAIDINRSGTRKEELLMTPDVLQRVWILRKFLNELNSGRGDGVPHRPGRKDQDQQEVPRVDESVARRGEWRAARIPRRRRVRDRNARAERV